MKQATAPGKIILSGEYAVVFGHKGIAIPAAQEVNVMFEEDLSANNIEIIYQPSNHQTIKPSSYIESIIDLCTEENDIPNGILTIENSIPFGKGMGSSTALIIAICKCLLGDDCEQEAKRIEDKLSPGNSGIDFAVIWRKKPILFQKGSEPTQIKLTYDILQHTTLLDSGTPNEQTPELVAWVTERKDELEDALNTIGTCTERLMNGEDLREIIRDHHRAQVKLGVVTDKAKELIKKIEQEGGAAKVIGAGGRSGGSGMILAFSYKSP